MRGSAVFPEVYSLPSSETERAFDDRDSEGAAGEDRFNVGWHVVGPLSRVGKVGVLLGNEAVKPLFEIVTS